MRNGRVFIDRFSAGLDELSKSDQGSTVAVMKALSKMKRFSCFEASDNQRIAKTMDGIIKRELIECSVGTYPWTYFIVTEAGQKIIDSEA